MQLDLKPEELRVLGVLIEKSLSQPAYYPMTVNSITNACNQKSNRNPITSYEERVVSDALASLRRKELTDQAEPEPGSRSVKFRHRIEEKFDWDAPQRAMLAELILRGPQTAGELRSRASRMSHLGSTDYARELLRDLENRQPPLVVEMAKEPGRSARRFAHLLGDSMPESSAEVPAAAPQFERSEPVEEATPDTLARVISLENEIAHLRITVSHIQEVLREAGLGAGDGSAPGEMRSDGT